MGRSLTSVTLFTVALLSSNAYAQAGYSNSTTTSIGGYFTPAAPIIESSDSSLVVPSTSAVESTSAPAPVAYSQTEGATTTTYPTSTDLAATSYSDVSTSEAPSSEPAVSTTAAVSTPIAYTSASTPEAYSSPVVASSDTAYTSASTPEAYSSPVVASSDIPVPTPSSDASSATIAPSPIIASSDTALSTPESSSGSPTLVFSYAPQTTDTAGASETVAQFTYAPKTSTTAPAGLLVGYIGSIVASSASAAASSNAAAASSNGLVATLSRPAETDLATPQFVYKPSSTDAMPAAATVSVGSSAVSIAPVPQTYVEGESSSAPAAYVIGSQTASVGQTLTVDDTPVVIQTSAGETQVYAGSSAVPSALSFATAAPSAAYSFSPDSTDSGDITVTGAPTVMTLGVATVSQDSAGNYMVGSTTLAPGSSITQVAGSSSAIIGLQATNGTTRVVVQDASMTTTTILPKITKPATRTVTASASQHLSEIIVNGHTYHLGPASLNAHQTGSATASSGFATSGSGAGSATSSSAPGLQSNGASRSAWSMLLVGAGAVILGYSLLL